MQKGRFMFPFFTAFFIFVLVLNISLRRNSRKQDAVDRKFWEQELKANATRRQDISGLDYIIIPSEIIPQNLHTEAEKNLLALTSCQMLNLKGQSNTELKLKYGVANLEALGQYEANFSRFQSILPVYAKELIEAGQKEDAVRLLEFAVEKEADATPIYRLLANLYQENNQKEKLLQLLEKAKALTSLSGRIITEDLTKRITQPMED